MQEMLQAFALDSPPVSCERFGNGHINDTFKAVCMSGRAYILQRINQTVFKNPVQVMENIVRVTDYLRKKGAGPREALRLVPAKDGGMWHTDAQGDVWRVYDYIEDTICLDAAATAEDFYQSALGFGRFQKQLADFPADALHETIKDFHNTPQRYENLRRAVKRDALGRAGQVHDELAFAFSMEQEASEPMRLLRAGKLPLRVTHNDTKLNNVLLDAKTRLALCVVDLDTVMPGLSLFDFGDAIRFGASTAAEDERELSRVRMDIGLFRTYAEGYLSVCGDSLTPDEIRLLPLGALVMTLENGVRFLTDHLEGDVYFRIHRPGHNLDRCRTQFQLTRSMQAQWREMQAVVESVC